MVQVVLDQVNVVVRDMEAMAAFYEQLGLEIDSGLPQWAAHHRQAAPGAGADLDLDSPEFAALWNRGWPGGAGVVLGFRVPTRNDVDELFALLTAAGHPAQQSPYDAFWGARYAVVTDPDGNAVGLMSPPDPAFRSPPPAPPS